MIDDLSPFLTIKQASELLNVSVSTLTLAIDTGKLPALRLGESHGGTRIRRSDLFPSDTGVNDLRVRRLRRLVTERRVAREFAEQMRSALADADAKVAAIDLQIERELAADDLDSTTTLRRSA